MPRPRNLTPSYRRRVRAARPEGDGCTRVGADDGQRPDPPPRVFSPRREREERNARRAASRTTKFYQCRQGWQQRKANPKRPAGQKYTVSSFGYAVRRACEGHGLESWTPNQLRHTFGTRVRKAHGWKPPRCCSVTHGPT